MDANKILQSDVLDLLFEGRNKDYGAYQLRKKYSANLTIAMCGTAAFALSIFLSSLFFGKKTGKGEVKMSAVELIDIVYPPKEKTLEKIPEKTIVKKVATEDFVTPKIEKDDKVKKDEMPPEMSDLDKAIIGTEKIEGEAPDGRVLEPAKTAPVEHAEPAKEDHDVIQDVVEVEAEFPGGNKAWVKYVSREIERNIDELQEEGRSGTVVASFIVDREGVVSEVKILPCEQTIALSCAGQDSKLAEIALRAIRKGPKWKPAMKNGRSVKAYRKQQITFRLTDE